MLRLLSLALSAIAVASMDKSQCRKVLENEDPTKCHWMIGDPAWYCKNLPGVAGACPRTCNPNYKCICAPAWCKCESKALGDNGACLAQRLACQLWERMGKDWSGNVCQDDLCMSTVRSQMLAVCMNGETGDADEGTNAHRFLVNSTAGEVSPRKLQGTCPTQSCVNSTVEYLKDNKAAKYGIKVGKASASIALNIVKTVLKEKEMIGVEGGIVLTAISTFLGAFFPSPSAPSNPCDHAVGKDWGQCVWEQIGTYVKKYVTAKINSAFTDLWASQIKGIMGTLKEINHTAYIDSVHSGGDVIHMPKEVQDRMYNDMWGLHRNNLDVYIPTIFDVNTDSPVGGLYLSQFAALHINVMASLFSSWEYRTAGNRFEYQQKTACYAQKIYDRALEARNTKMALIKQTRAYCHKDKKGKETCDDLESKGHDTCYSLSQVLLCPWTKKTYSDTNPNADGSPCGYKVEVKLGGAQKGGRFGCRCLPEMDSFPSPDAKYKKQCLENHRKHVRKELDLMWLDWLSPMPHWLETVIKMGDALVKPPPTDLPPTETLSEAASDTFDCSFL